MTPGRTSALNQAPITLAELRRLAPPISDPHLAKYRDTMLEAAELIERLRTCAIDSGTIRTQPDPANGEKATPDGHK